MFHKEQKAKLKAYFLLCEKLKKGIVINVCGNVGIGKTTTIKNESLKYARCVYINASVYYTAYLIAVGIRNNIFDMDTINNGSNTSKIITDIIIYFQGAKEPLCVIIDNAEFINSSKEYSRLLYRLVNANVIIIQIWNQSEIDADNVIKFDDFSSDEKRKILDELFDDSYYFDDSKNINELIEKNTYDLILGELMKE